MCELNYKHKRVFDLEFFTSGDMTKEKFDEIVCRVCIEMEMRANEDGCVRCHIHQKEGE